MTSDTNAGGEPSSGAGSPEVLRAVMTSRRMAWGGFFVVLSVLCAVFGYFFFPQYYTSTTSIAMQQSTPSASSVAGLLNLSTLTRKYIGVLKSRRFMELAEQKAHLKEMYGLQRPSEMYDKYTRCVRFDDNATDGLIYISVTLDAPPLLRWGQSNRRERVRNTAALIANTYYSSLIDYLVNTDTDKELVLLRAADTERVRARNNYEASVARLASFVKSHRIRPEVAPSFPSSGAVMSGDASLSSSGSESSAAATQSISTYARKAQLEAQIASAEAQHNRLIALLKGPFQEVAAIPGEDPLLLSARQAYNQARRSYDTLNAQLGPENPRLVSAHNDLHVAEKHLRNQIQAVLRGDTTENMNLLSLRSQYATVLRQVGESDRNYQTSRELTTDLGRLAADASLNLKVLEAALTSSETLKMTTVAARNRANLVDEATPEDRSHPGKGMILGVSLLIAGVATGLRAAFEYNTALSQSAARHRVVTSAISQA